MTDWTSEDLCERVSQKLEKVTIYFQNTLGHYLSAYEVFITEKNE